MQVMPIGKKATKLTIPKQASAALCVNTYSLPRLRFARVKRAVRHKTTLRMHSVAFTFDDCTREMPMFTYRHANMNTKSSVKRYAQHQPHNMPTIATKPTHTSLFRGIAIRTANTATCRQSLAATAGAGCISKRRCTDLRSESLHRPATVASFCSAAGKALARRLIDRFGR